MLQPMACDTMSLLITSSTMSWYRHADKLSVVCLRTQRSTSDNGVRSLYLLTMVGMHSPIHHCTALCLDSISTAALLLLCCFALWAFCVFRLVLTVNYILFYCFCCIITSPVRAQGVEIYSRSCLIRTFCIHCCLSMSMDDWKLKTTPVVRLQRPSKTFVYFLCFFATLRYVTRISWILLTY